MRKLTRKNLDELAKVMPVLSEVQQSNYWGGAKGDADEPYSQDEFWRMLDNNQWTTGGYVSGMGYVAREAVVTGNSVLSHFSFADAKSHYQNGEGNRIDIQLSSLDLSNVRKSDFVNGIATIKLLGKHFSNLSDALIHGTITLVLIPGTNYARVAPNSNFHNEPVGMYDFEMHSWSNSVLRNIATLMGAVVSGTSSIRNPMTPSQSGGYEYVGGTPYPIYYHGSVYIPD